MARPRRHASRRRADGHPRARSRPRSRGDANPRSRGRHRRSRPHPRVLRGRARRRRGRRIGRDASLQRHGRASSPRPGRGNRGAHRRPADADGDRRPRARPPRCAPARGDVQARLGRRERRRRHRPRSHGSRRCRVAGGRDARRRDDAARRHARVSGRVRFRYRASRRGGRARRPPRLVGAHEHGVLRVGARADVVAIDPDTMAPQRVWLAGAPVPLAR